MKAQRFIILTLLFLAGFHLSAQVPLDLDEAIDLMKENNTQLKIQQQEIELSKNELKGSLSGFLPDVSVSHTGFYTNDPLNVFGLKLQQKVVTQADFNPELLNDPNGFQHFTTKFAVEQPLLNFDAFAARKALKEKVQAVGYQKEFAEDMLVVEVRKTYTNLQFLFEAKEAVEKGVSAYEEVLRNTENMKDQGYAKESDVLMVKVGLSEVENKLIEIDNNIANLSDYMSWLMGTENQVSYLPTQTLSQTIEPVEDTVEFSEGRADVLAMKSGIEAQNKMLSMHNNGLLPRLNAFGEFNYQDENIVGFGANAYMAGISLSWNIFDGNKTLNSIQRSKINIAKAETEMQLHIEENELELQKTQRQLSANQAKLNLVETAKEQASEALRILENRYAQGLEKTADLLVSQATELEKQVNYLEVIKEHNLLMIQIDFLTNNNNN